MHEDKTIGAAVSVLANTMRLYVEAHFRFGALLKVDREEAINSLDRAFEAKLEAFHSLYDVSKMRFAYFDYADTTLLIAVRNAIHHRNHPLFRSLFARLFLDDEAARWAGATFLLAAHPTLHGAPILMHHHIRLEDLDTRLDPRLTSPHRDKALKPEKASARFELIERELALPVIRQEANLKRYPNDQTYLDLMPIFVSAVARTFKALKAGGIEFMGFDADTYVRSFTTDIKVDLYNPAFTAWQIGE